MKWTSEERREEVEGRIVDDIETALLMPFYDQDKERGEEYRGLLLKALKLYSPRKARLFIED